MIYNSNMFDHVNDAILTFLSWWCWCQVFAEGGRQCEPAQRWGSHTFGCSHTESSGSHHGSLEGSWCTVESWTFSWPQKTFGATATFQAPVLKDTWSTSHGIVAIACLFSCSWVYFSQNSRISEPGREMLVSILWLFRASAVCDCCEPAFLKSEGMLNSYLSSFLSIGTVSCRPKATALMRLLCFA